MPRGAACHRVTGPKPYLAPVPAKCSRNAGAFWPHLLDIVRCRDRIACSLQPLLANNSAEIWGTFHEHSRCVAPLSYTARDRVDVDARHLDPSKMEDGRREPLSTLSQSFDGGSSNDQSWPGAEWRLWKQKSRKAAVRSSIASTDLCYGAAELPSRGFVSDPKPHARREDGCGWMHAQVSAYGHLRCMATFERQELSIGNPDADVARHVIAVYGTTDRGSVGRPPAIR